MDFLTPELIALIITTLLGVFGTSKYWLKAKKVLAAGKEVVDAYEALNEALADDKLTSDEIKRIQKEGKEAVNAIKGLF